jgi:hypothetical protein
MMLHCSTLDTQLRPLVRIVRGVQFDEGCASALKAIVAAVCEYLARMQVPIASGSFDTNLVERAGLREPKQSPPQLSNVTRNGSGDCRVSITATSRFISWEGNSVQHFHNDVNVAWLKNRAFRALNIDTFPKTLQ